MESGVTCGEGQEAPCIVETEEGDREGSGIWLGRSKGLLLLRQHSLQL